MVEIINFAKPELNKDIKSKLSKKILCIIEGKLELKYIHKIFQICGYTKKCDDLDRDYIKLSWGKEQKIKKCNFQGGDIKNFPTPKPAIESLNQEKDNFWLYEYIIILFDSDRDMNHIVENHILNEKNEKIILLTSNPCFEATLIDYCKTAKKNIETKNINKNGKSSCEEYKKNFSKLGCSQGVSYLIHNLKLFTTQNIQLNTIRYHINLFFNKYSKTIDQKRKDEVLP